MVIIGENDTRQVDLGFAPPNVPPIIGTIPDVTASKSKSPVALQVNFTDADTSDTHQCDWQFGDNQTGSSNAIQNPTEPLQRTCKIDHSYGAPGTYQVELTVTDSNNQQANTTFKVNVPNTFPTVDLGKDMSVNKATPVQFVGTVQDHDGDEITTMWDFGDNTPEVLDTLTTTHTYDNPGVYTVTLTATDTRGGTSSDQLIVTVERVAVFPIGDNDKPIEIGDSISVSLKGLSEEQWFTVQLDDDLGRQWSFAKLSSDQAGEIRYRRIVIPNGCERHSF
ncbi:MAG: PKD domain-containing protein [Thioploca sp.]|nr:PKD domain-containing protein [Thioploca sp.]